MADFEQKYPGSDNANNSTRFLITAYDILKQNLDANDPNHFDIDPAPLYSWSLLAPQDVQENVAHTYEEYSSFQGRAAQLKSDIVQTAGKAKQVVGGLGKTAGNTSPSYNKVDSPIIWTGSNRKEYSITFVLAWYESNTPYDEVFFPIHKFRQLSCASIGGQIDTITPPAVFNVITIPADFISITYAALTNVQTTYNAPFVGGYPARAELTLTFQDYKPLYRQHWNNGKAKVTAEVRNAANRGAGGL